MCAGQRKRVSVCQPTETGFCVPEDENGIPRQTRFDVVWLKTKRMPVTRRTFGVLAGSATSLTTGCLTSNTGWQNRSETDTQNTAIDASRIEVAFEPRTDGNSAKARERVILINASDDPIDLEGCRLVYQSGPEYEFSDLVLEPRAKVAVVSRGVGDSTALSDPPTYYRDAELDSLVLEDGEERVTLLSPSGAVVLEATYEPSA